MAEGKFQNPKTSFLFVYSLQKPRLRPNGFKLHTCGLRSRLFGAKAGPEKKSQTWPCTATLITPAPVCANMIQTLVHTCRGPGCSIIIEINVKKQSNPSPLKVFNIQYCLAQLQAQLFQNIISKSVCLLGTTAGVIRVNGNLESWKMHVLLEILYVKIVSLPLKMVSVRRRRVLYLSSLRKPSGLSEGPIFV